MLPAASAGATLCATVLSWRIERRDGANHADRHAERECQAPLVLTGRTLNRHELAGDALGLLSGDGQRLDAAVEVVEAVICGEAALRHHRSQDLVLAFAQEPRGRREDFVALVRMERPGLERAFCDRNRALDEIATCATGMAEHLAGVFVAHRDAIRRRNPFSADEQRRVEIELHGFAPFHQVDSISSAVAVGMGASG